jgi:hypothetical protein
MMSARVHDADLPRCPLPVALGGRADIECVLTNSKSKRSCKLVNRERVGETHARVWDPLDPCILHMGPVAVGSGLVRDPRERKCWTRSFLSWSPMRRTAVLSSAAAAAFAPSFEVALGDTPEA